MMYRFINYNHYDEQIVVNRRSGLDANRFDYITRDAAIMGKKVDLDWRLLKTVHQLYYFPNI